VIGWTLAARVERGEPKCRDRNNTPLSLVQPHCFLRPPRLLASPSTSPTCAEYPTPIQSPSWSGQRSTFDRICELRPGSCRVCPQVEADRSRVAGVNGSSADRKLSPTPPSIQRNLYLQHSSFSIAHAFPLLR
jgi:hypothetical protein